MPRKKIPSQEGWGAACPLAEQHFGGEPLARLVATFRTFPGTFRADLQRSLDELLKDARLYGLYRNRLPIRLAHLLERVSPVMVAPVESEELDIGDPLPLGCLRQGMWLFQRSQEPLLLLLAAQEDGSVVLELASRPGGVREAKGFLEELDDVLARAHCYRGKVLSLESDFQSRGLAGPVRVYRLAPVTRDDLILPERTVRLLERNVGDFIRQRPRLRRLGMPVKKGLLFYGPPGTGKTHTVRYLAGLLPDHTTLLITADQVHRLNRYIQLARFLQPVILVLEDVDLIGRDRRQMGTQDETLLNELLNEMDGMREDAEVIFILTTNRPEELEAALSSRPGRIDQAIEFPMPDDEGRRKLIQLYSRGLQLEPRALSGGVLKSGGASAAFIKELMRRAAQYYLRDGGKGKLQPAHLDQALSEMVFEGGSLNLKLLGASQEMAREPVFRWTD